MQETRRSRSELDRTRAAAITLGAMAVAYVALSVFYFWQDWFQYYRVGGAMQVDPAGVAVPVTEYIWTILSPWRIPLALLAVSLLGLSSYKLATEARGRGRCPW